MQSPLLAISPIDGRYQEKTAILQDFFSEKALIFYRLKVEIFWLKSLHSTKDIKELKPLSKASEEKLDALLANFTINDAHAIKKIEQSTNHDVKAVEYFISQLCKGDDALKECISFVHFGLTSEDVNNLAYNLMLKEGVTNAIIPALNNLKEFIKSKAVEYKSMPMMAKTHGQPATPTTVGKEFANVFWRLGREVTSICSMPFLSKCNGATGNYSALYAAYPEIDWQTHSKTFIESLGLDFNPLTTQIEPHDGLANIFMLFSRINTILLDFSRDCWNYISCGYFKQKVKAGEVGSSTMPHKVNPIDFENAEGNFGIANALLMHFAQKLPVSRLQRDLSDSTVLRNIGVAFAHSFIAYQAMTKGLDKIAVDTALITNELNNHWELLAEPVQTVMRRYGIVDAYEQLKQVSRGKPLTKEALHTFVESLSIPKQAKKDLLTLTPEHYLGIAVALVDEYLS